MEGVAATKFIYTILWRINTWVYGDSLLVKTWKCSELREHSLIVG